MISRNETWVCGACGKDQESMLTDYYGTSAVTCPECGAGGVVEFEEITTDDASWMSWVWSPAPVDASQPDAHSVEVTPAFEANP